VLLAQALGEYASLSAILTSMEEAWLSVKYQISGVESQTWMLIGVGVLALIFLMNRR
jgi:hypothetical protein